MKLPLLDRQGALKAHSARIERLRTIHTQYPLPSLRLPEEVTLDPEKMLYVEREDFGKAEKLSLFGWTCIVIDSVQLLACMACHRRIGLWGFKSGEEGLFDVIREHRDYCPWVNSVSQVSPVPGWKLLTRWLDYEMKKKDLDSGDTRDLLNVRLNRLRNIFGLKTVSLESKMAG